MSKLHYLRHEGLLNESAPHLDDLIRTGFTRQSVEAWCTSEKCAGFSPHARVRRHVEYGTAECPECDGALVWKSPGAKGRRTRWE